MTRSFPTDPLEVLAINDAHRHPGVAPGADLWSADELAALPPQVYDYRIPTLTPSIWPSSRRVSQKAYDAEFERRTPLAAKLLKLINFPDGSSSAAANAAPSMPHLVVAGGAAAAPYYERNIEAGDVDFFLVGLDRADPAHETRLWKAADTFVSVLRDVTQGEVFNEIFGPNAEIREVAQMMSPGLLSLTIRVYHDDGYGIKKSLKYQLILRAYPSASALVHAFDIPSSCTLYDGKTAFSTTLGAYAHRFRVNLINPAYRSTTYEARLVKYFGRLYALGLVHCKMGLMKPNEELRLPHLILRPSVVRGNRATGSAELLPESAVDTSDYEPAGPNPNEGHWDGGNMAQYMAAYLNLKQLASGDNRFVMIRCTNICLRHHHRHSRNATESEWLPFKNWYADGKVDPPTFEDIFPKDDFNRAITHVIAGAYDSMKAVRTASLSKFLGMTLAEITRLVEVLTGFVRQNPRRRITIVDTLAPFRKRLEERYEAAAAKPIAWWIKEDPGRQYTASLNPRMEDPAEWYGADRLTDKPGTVTSEIYTESLLAALESQNLPEPDGREAPVYDGRCTLCLFELPPGSANCIILPCGHVFHASCSALTGCRGLLQWFSDGHTDCPNCRDSLEDPDEEDDNSGAIDVPLRLIIDWGNASDS